MLKDKIAFKNSILALAQKWDFMPEALEKDYYATWILCHMHKFLPEQLLLRGATALSKQNLDHHRLNQDLDLTIYGERKDSTTHSQCLKMIDLIQQKMVLLLNETGFIGLQPHVEVKYHARVLSYSIPYPSFITGHLNQIIMDIQLDHRPLVRPEYQIIKHFYKDPITDESMIPPCQMLVLCLDELVAEKLIKMLKYGFIPSIRDYYDLSKLIDTGFDFEKVSFIKIFKEKLREYFFIRDYKSVFGLNGSKQRQLNQEVELYLRPFIHCHEEFFPESVCEKLNHILSKGKFHLGCSDHYWPYIQRACSKTYDYR